MTLQPRRRSKSPAALARQWHLAAKAVSNAVFRLGIALKDYDPNQPRVPAGQPGAGQWVGENSSTGTSQGEGSDRIDLAQIEMGTLIAILPDWGAGRRCVYRFGHGDVIIPASNQGACWPKFEWFGTTHGKLLNDNLPKGFSK